MPFCLRPPPAEQSAGLRAERPSLNCSGFSSDNIHSIFSLTYVTRSISSLYVPHLRDVHLTCSEWPDELYHHSPLPTQRVSVVAYPISSQVSLQAAEQRGLQPVFIPIFAKRPSHASCLEARCTYSWVVPRPIE